MAEKTVAELLADKKLRERIAKVKAQSAEEGSEPLTPEENERARRMQIEDDAKAAEERLAGQRRRSTDVKPESTIGDTYSRDVSDVPTGPGSATDKLERIKRGEAVPADASTADEHPEVASAQQQAEKAQKKVTVAKTKVAAEKAKEVHAEAKASVNDDSVKPSEVEAATSPKQAPTQAPTPPKAAEAVEAEHIPAPSKSGVPAVQKSEAQLAEWADNVAESPAKQEEFNAMLKRATPAQIEAAASHLPPGAQAEVTSLAHSGSGRGRILGVALAAGAGAAYALYSNLKGTPEATAQTPSAAPAAAPTPTAPKEGDKDMLNGVPYTFTNGKWTPDGQRPNGGNPGPSNVGMPKPNRADYVVPQKELDARMAKLAAIPRTLSPEAQATYDARRKEIQTLMDDAETRFKDRENTAQWAQVAELVGHALTKLGAGYYGLKTGYDLSGIKFDKNDWQKEMDRIYDHYDKTVTRNLKMKEGVYDDQAAAEKNVATSGHAQATEMENLWKGRDEGNRQFGRDTLLGQIAGVKEAGANAREASKEQASTNKATETADAKAANKDIDKLDSVKNRIATAKPAAARKLAEAELQARGFSKKQIEDIEDGDDTFGGYLTSDKEKVARLTSTLSELIANKRAK